MDDSDEEGLETWGDQRNWYRNKVDKMGKVFDILKQKNLPKGKITSVAFKTHIKVNTLRTWRRKLLVDENYRPYQAYGVTTLDKSVEDNFESHIKQNYFNLGVPLSRSDVCDMAIDVYEQCPPDSVHRNIFAASYKWLKRFQRDHTISFRKPHGQKRGKISENSVIRYIHQVNSLYRRYEHKFIFNMDETCYYTSYQCNQVLAEVGSEYVPGGENGKPKESFTAIITISKANDVLPAWFVAKGTTEACEKAQFGDESLFADDEVLTHSKNGWCTEQTMLEYLQWLSKYNQGKNIALILDVYRAHRTEAVKNRARELNIELVYVPANGTSLYQPLDLRIMGILKKKSIAAWELERRKQRFGIVWNKSKAALACSRILTDEITASNVASAWNSISHINDDRYMAAEFDSDVDESGDESDDEYQE